MARPNHASIFRKGPEAVLEEQRAAIIAAREILLGAYERISDDQEDEGTGDRGAGVGRQSDTLVKLCIALTAAGPSTWTIYRHYTDNDLSAFKDVVRPEFELLLADLEAGVIEGIVVYDLDRLARRPKDLERLIDIYDKAAKAGRRLFFQTIHDPIDLSSPDGITLARVMVAFANKSSRDTARRVAGKHRATALTGRPVGGTRPFGWNWTSERVVLADGRVLEPAVGAKGKPIRHHVINEAEAAEIRRVAADVLLGVGLNTICRDLTERGIRTPRGNEWRPNPLKLMLESPRLAGFRVHRGTLLPAENGEGWVLGNWDPILDVDTWEQVATKLAGKGGQKARSEAQRSYLLSGILRCYLCHGPLYGNARADLGHFYACKVRGGAGGKAGCGKVTCSGPPVDDVVTEWAKKRMLTTAAAVKAEGPWPREGELEEAKRQMGELVPLLTEATGEGKAMLSARFARLSDAVDELRTERSVWLLERGNLVRRAMVTPDTFDDLPLDVQRQYLRGELVSLFVKPATVRGNRFDYSRLVPVWRGTADEVPGDGVPAGEPTA